MSMSIAELETKTVTELRDIARDWDLSGYTALKKQDLIFRLLQAQTERQGNIFSGGVLDIVDDGFGFLRRGRFLPGATTSTSRSRRFAASACAPATWSPARCAHRRTARSTTACCASRPSTAWTPRSPSAAPTSTASRRSSRASCSTWRPSRQHHQRLINLLIAPIGRGQRGLIVSPPKAGKTLLLKPIANAARQLPRHPPDGRADRRATRRSHRHEALRARPRSLARPSTRSRGPHARRRDGTRARQAPGGGRQGRRDPARQHHPPDPRLQPGRPAERPHALRRHRPGRAHSAQALLRRGAQHRGGRQADDHRHLPGGYRQPHGRRDLRGVQGHRQHGAHLDRKLAERRIFPAIDITRSGTRREELLLDEKALRAVV